MSPSARTPLLIVGGGLLIGLAVGLIVLFGLPPARGAQGAVIGDPGTPQVIAPAPVVGAPAPDFHLQDTAGNYHTIADAKGHPLLINFWATWCGPCRVEMPAIEARYQSNQAKGLMVYAVDADEPKPDVEDFARTFKLSFTVLLDPGAKVQDLYQIRGYPTSFFVDGKGVIKVVHIGAMTERQLDDNLAKILP
ncbi:MAG: redoxin domain-containing protein [Chloroflexi bacterium]|nr:redoxin domain-containing protein [Chloroflexota bacterium]